MRRWRQMRRISLCEIMNDYSLPFILCILYSNLIRLLLWTMRGNYILCCQEHSEYGKYSHASS